MKLKKVKIGALMALTMQVVELKCIVFVAQEQCVMKGGTDMMLL